MAAPLLAAHRKVQDLRRRLERSVVEETQRRLHGELRDAQKALAALLEQEADQ